ncbi:MAG: hypothetical protein BGP06_19485 [Rhizobiales bacterium 65-9]|nr:MAG: hypothetical protein BGP06_19485 [Rhizobiales bacterium 65-9]
MSPSTLSGPRRNWKLISLLIVGISIAVMIGANAHLVYVAITSQTGCVPHTKDAGSDGAFRAAKSAC